MDLQKLACIISSCGSLIFRKTGDGNYYCDSCKVKQVEITE